MKYTKILTIILISVIVCTSISAVIMARTSREEKEEPSKPLEIPLLELTMQLFVSSEGCGSSLMEFKYGEVMNVTATIWNRCEYGIELDEMDVRLKTLDFFIRPMDTDPGKPVVIHYIYPFEGEPAPVIIEPGESYVSRLISLNGCSSGAVFNVLGLYTSARPSPYDFIPGNYSICAKYVSNLAITPRTSDIDPVIFTGELESSKLNFEIVE